MNDTPEGRPSNQDIRWVLRDTGTAAERLDITQAAELADLGMPAISAIVRSLKVRYYVAFAGGQYVDLQIEQEDYTSRFNWLDWVAEYAPYTPLIYPPDRGLEFFWRRKHKVYMPDNSAKWDWQRVVLCGIERDMAWIRYKEEEPFNLPFDSAHLISEEDWEFLCEQPVKVIRRWMQAARTIASDSLRRQLESTFTGVLSTD